MATSRKAKFRKLASADSLHNSNTSGDLDINIVTQQHRRGHTASPPPGANGGHNNNSEDDSSDAEVDGDAYSSEEDEDYLSSESEFVPQANYAGLDGNKDELEDDFGAIQDDDLDFSFSTSRNPILTRRSVGRGSVGRKQTRRKRSRSSGGFMFINGRTQHERVFAGGAAEGQDDSTSGEQHQREMKTLEQQKKAEFQQSQKQQQFQAAASLFKNLKNKVAGHIIWNAFQDLFVKNRSKFDPRKLAAHKLKDEIAIVDTWVEQGRKERWAVEETSLSKENHTTTILKAILGGKGGGRLGVGLGTSSAASAQHLAQQLLDMSSTSNAAAIGSKQKQQRTKENFGSASAAADSKNVETEIGLHLLLGSGEKAVATVNAILLQLHAELADTIARAALRNIEEVEGPALSTAELQRQRDNRTSRFKMATAGTSAATAKDAVGADDHAEKVDQDENPAGAAEQNKDEDEEEDSASDITIPDKEKERLERVSKVAEVTNPLTLEVDVPTSVLSSISALASISSGGTVPSGTVFGDHDPLTSSSSPATLYDFCSSQLALPAEGAGGINDQQPDDFFVSNFVRAMERNASTMTMDRNVSAVTAGTVGGTASLASDAAVAFPPPLPSPLASTATVGGSLGAQLQKAQRQQFYLLSALVYGSDAGGSGVVDQSGGPVVSSEGAAPGADSDRNNVASSQARKSPEVSSEQRQLYSRQFQALAQARIKIVNVDPGSAHEMLKKRKVSHKLRQVLDRVQQQTLRERERLRGIQELLKAIGGGGSGQPPALEDVTPGETKKKKKRKSEKSPKKKKREQAGKTDEDDQEERGVDEEIIELEDDEQLPAATLDAPPTNNRADNEPRTTTMGNSTGAEDASKVAGEEDPDSPAPALEDIEFSIEDDALDELSSSLASSDSEDDDANTTGDEMMKTSRKTKSKKNKRKTKTPKQFTGLSKKTRLEDLLLDVQQQQQSSSDIFCHPVNSDGNPFATGPDFGPSDIDLLGDGGAQGGKTKKQNWTSRLNLNESKGLLSHPTFRQLMHNETQDQVIELVGSTSFRHKQAIKDFENKSIAHTEYCEFRTRQQCEHNRGPGVVCKKIHFKRVIRPWTELALGDCSYLNTCRKMNTCKYVHYTLDLTFSQTQEISSKLGQNFASSNQNAARGGGEGGTANDDSTNANKTNNANALLNVEAQDARKINELQIRHALPSQWINCDVRSFDFGILHNQVDVIMADPPWHIHMELPYGTLTDDEMRSLPIEKVHDNGMIFLWVTGRAAELARDCMKKWGYKRVEEIIWVKTNQLQRVIRTGRTGHWLNHSKEHCIVGIKGKPRGMNRNLDCDVIVSEVRETSRKPDEVYNLIERMFPTSLKLEIFGRPHNAHRNWVTLGNQLLGVHLCNEELVRRYNENCLKDGEPPVEPFDPNDPNEANRVACADELPPEPEEEAKRIRDGGKPMALTDSGQQGQQQYGNAAATNAVGGKNGSNYGQQQYNPNSGGGGKQGYNNFGGHHQQHHYQHQQGKNYNSNQKRGGGAWQPPTSSSSKHGGAGSTYATSARPGPPPATGAWQPPAAGGGGPHPLGGGKKGAAPPGGGGPPTAAGAGGPAMGAWVPPLAVPAPGANIKGVAPVTATSSSAVYSNFAPPTPPKNRKESAEFRTGTQDKPPSVLQPVIPTTNATSSASAHNIKGSSSSLPANAVPVATSTGKNQQKSSSSHTVLAASSNAALGGPVAQPAMVVVGSSSTATAGGAAAGATISASTSVPAGGAAQNSWKPPGSAAASGSSAQQQQQASSGTTTNAATGAVVTNMIASSSSMAPGTTSHGAAGGPKPVWGQQTTWSQKSPEGEGNSSGWDNLVAGTGTGSSASAGAAADAHAKHPAGVPIATSGTSGTREQRAQSGQVPGTNPPTLPAGAQVLVSSSGPTIASSSGSRVVPTVIGSSSVQPVGQVLVSSSGPPRPPPGTAIASSTPGAAVGTTTSQPQVLISSSSSAPFHQQQRPLSSSGAGPHQPHVVLGSSSKGGHPPNAQQHQPMVIMSSSTTTLNAPPSSSGVIQPPSSSKGVPMYHSPGGPAAHNHNQPPPPIQSYGKSPMGDAAAANGANKDGFQHPGGKNFFSGGYNHGGQHQQQYPHGGAQHHHHGGGKSGGKKKDHQRGGYHGHGYYGGGKNSYGGGQQDYDNPNDIPLGGGKGTKK